MIKVDNIKDLYTNMIAGKEAIYHLFDNLPFQQAYEGHKENIQPFIKTNNIQINNFPIILSTKALKHILERHHTVSIYIDLDTIQKYIKQCISKCDKVEVKNNVVKFSMFSNSRRREYFNVVIFNIQKRNAYLLTSYVVYYDEQGKKIKDSTEHNKKYKLDF